MMSSIDADVDVEAVLQRRRGLEQQRCALRDHAADVVRQAAVRERDVAGGLQDDDLAILVVTTNTGRRRHTAGGTTNDDCALGHEKPKIFLSGLVDSVRSQVHHWLAGTDALT